MGCGACPTSSRRPVVAKKSKSTTKLETALREVFTNTPSTVKKSTPDKEHKQKIAIAFSKARKRGANLPARKAK